MLVRRGIRVVPSCVLGLDGSAPALAGIRMDDGRVVAVQALFVPPVLEVRSPVAGDLGCAIDDAPAGRLLRTDAEKLTTVPGVYAAGDAALPRSNITLAADGVRAGLGLHHSLIEAA